tara:strand:+ start:20 stop:631 length:612 start_codon:yes stop_codon:yes gene_type:complete
MNIENMTSKELSDELSNHGINMHFNTKRDKLVNALNNVDGITNGSDISVSSKGKTAEQLAEEMGVTMLTDNDIVDFQYNGVELEGLRKAEANKLIRVIVRSNNPLKRDHAGDIFTVGNKLLNNGKAIKKYIPYNNEEGWFIPNILYEHLLAAECQIFKKAVRNGQEFMEPQNIKAFNVEVLPPLTDDEVEKLRVKQKATGSIG